MFDIRKNILIFHNLLHNCVLHNKTKTHSLILQQEFPFVDLINVLGRRRKERNS